MQHSFLIKKEISLNKRNGRELPSPDKDTYEKPQPAPYLTVKYCFSPSDQEQDMTVYRKF